MLALLQNPEALGHPDMTEVPPDRTELSMRLATEVCWLDRREQRLRIRARLAHPLPEVRNINHAASWPSRAIRSTSVASRQVTIWLSGTTCQAGSAESFSDATTTASGKSAPLHK